MASRKTIIIRAPKDIIKKLRFDFPGMSDADLIRMQHNTSLIKNTDISSILNVQRRLNVKRKKG